MPSSNLRLLLLAVEGKESLVRSDMREAVGMLVKGVGAELRGET